MSAVRWLAGLLALAGLAWAEPAAPTAPPKPVEPTKPAKPAEPAEPVKPMGPTAARSARYRLLHACPELGEAQVYVNGQKVEPAPIYGQLTPYQTLRAGVHNFKLQAAKSPQVLDDRDATLDAGADYTIAIVGTAKAPAFLRLLDRRPEADPRGHLRAVNLVADGPAVAVRPVGDPVLARLGFGQAMRPVPVGPLAARYVFEAAGRDAPLTQTEETTVSRGHTMTFWLIGRMGGQGPAAVRVLADQQAWPAPEAYDPRPGELLPQPAPPPVTRLRVLHVAPGGPALDGQLDGRLLLRGLAYGEVTDYVPVEPGRRRLQLTAGGRPLAAAELDLQAGTPHTALIIGKPGQVSVWFLTDDAGDAPAARVRVVHAALGLREVTVKLGGTTPLVDRVGELLYSAYVSLPDGANPRQIALHRPGEDTVLKAAALSLTLGSSYTLVVIGTTDPAWPDAAVGLRLLKDG